MKIRKLISALLLLIAGISFCSSKPVEKKVKSIEGKDGVFAVMETSKGTIVLELYYKKTPLTVINFVGLSEGTLDASKGKHFYDGLTFHRVIKDFMIQGGDPSGNGTGGPGYKFPDEIVENLKFDDSGVLAMANAGANTNGSQFFITHVKTPWLNGKHTIFGHVVEGQDVVNAIQQGDKIEKVTIIRQGTEAEKFTATQDDFNKTLKNVAKAEEERKVAAAKKQKELLSEKYGKFDKDSNGIMYKITKAGTGTKCGSGKTVAVEYKGYFLNGTVFDQSAGRGPLGFTTNAGRMIPGFDIMVQDMKLGEKRTFVLPPAFAYGDRTVGPIPANSYIVFDVELTDIN